jgi:Mn2+/Fe2+ NRAMP family transporter
MGRYANSPLNKAVLSAVTVIVTFLNIMLLIGFIFPGSN